MVEYTELAIKVVEYLQAAGPVAGVSVATGFGTGIGKAVGEKGFEQARSIWTWLRGKFTRPADRGALDQFEQDPSDPNNCRDLVDQVCKALERDSGFRDELVALLPEEFRAAGVNLNATIMGNENVTIQNVGAAANISVGGKQAGQAARR